MSRKSPVNYIDCGKKFPNITLRMDNSSMENLVELIPLLDNLNTLTIESTGNKVIYLMQQLCKSKVSNLSVSQINSETLKDHHFLSALAQLISPSSGKLKTLSRLAIFFSLS